MCDDVTCEYLRFLSMAGMDDITYEDLNPDVCKNVVYGLLI